MKQAVSLSCWVKSSQDWQVRFFLVIKRDTFLIWSSLALSVVLEIVNESIVVGHSFSTVLQPPCCRPLRTWVPNFGLLGSIKNDVAKPLTFQPVSGHTTHQLKNPSLVVIGPHWWRSRQLLKLNDVWPRPWENLHRNWNLLSYCPCGGGLPKVEPIPSLQKPIRHKPQVYPITFYTLGGNQRLGRHVELQHGNSFGNKNTGMFTELSIPHVPRIKPKVVEKAEQKIQQVELCQLQDSNSLILQ